MFKNTETLPEGLVTMSDYLRLIDSKNFHQIEKYSNKFVKQTEQILEPYSKKWVRDPLHQWSRQWEYPYVIANISKFAEGKEELSVLDLGSGITFLPYYLKDVIGIHDVRALDNDHTLGELFDKVNKSLRSNVEFINEDIRELEKSKQKSFDFIYCVSVLEHTDQYPAIIKSCHKLLRPGGYFCLSFDVSLDGYDDIPVDEAKKLLAMLERTFKIRDLKKYLDKDFDSVVSSKKVSKIDKKLMPWKYPIVNILKPVLLLEGVGSAYKNLTICCVTVRK